MTPLLVALAHDFPGSPFAEERHLNGLLKRDPLNNKLARKHRKFNTGCANLVMHLSKFIFCVANSVFSRIKVDLSNVLFEEVASTGEADLAGCLSKLPSTTRFTKILDGRERSFPITGSCFVGGGDDD